MLNYRTLAAVVALISSPLCAEQVHLLSAPCRVADTRGPIWVAGPVPPGQEQHIAVRGDAVVGFPGASQGGSATCGVPLVATAVFATITVVNASGDGTLVAGPYQSLPTPPLATVSFHGGGLVSTLALVRLNPPGSGHDMGALLTFASAHLTFDLVGYVTP